jgi:hypothetical protein
VVIDYPRGRETGLANGWQVKRPDTSWLIVANWVFHKSALAGGDRMQFNQLKRRCFAPPSVSTPGKVSNGAANSSEFNFCFLPLALAGVVPGASSSPSNGGAQQRKAYPGSNEQMFGAITSLARGTQQLRSMNSRSKPS